MESWCKGLVVDIQNEDKALFVKSYITEMKKAMCLSFAPLMEVTLNGSCYQAQHNVFNNQDLMKKIFKQVECNQDKANMAMVCRNWSQLFLFHTSAPRIEVAYWLSLHINDINGVRSFYRGSRVVYQRCKCFMTEDMTAKVILHFQQQKNQDQSSHLNGLDDIAIAQVNEFLRSLATPSVTRDKAISIAADLLTSRTLSCLDLPCLMEI